MARPVNKKGPKAQHTKDELARIVKTWEFYCTKEMPVRVKPEESWLWRTCEPYRLSASGICFTMRELKERRSNDNQGISEPSAIPQKYDPQDRG